MWFPALSMVEGALPFQELDKKGWSRENLSSLDKHGGCVPAHAYNYSIPFTITLQS